MIRSDAAPAVYEGADEALVRRSAPPDVVDEELPALVSEWLGVGFVHRKNGDGAVRGGSDRR